ncbi:MAG: Glu/Leu/Phe/Val dehydrogenase dimerization domain-containing protein [Tissierellia bacterium]|nr:Glu/Leu/Phe/Val dehydrogenase dimerization domain-containing protein [Tissierellia bacterium]
MDIFKIMQESDYENLIFSQDKETGLKAITCIHNTTLGPAIGGLRIWNYESEEDAITDVIRLAKGMTYKNAACGIYAGGAKTVMMVDPEKNPKTEEMMRAFGRFVEGMNGRYLTAEDVGSSEADMDAIYQETNFVLGTNMKPGTSGNPSPSTARGVYIGLKATCKEKYGDDSLAGKKIVVEGLGNVGLCVCKYALEEGAEVYGTDINEKAIEKAKEAGVKIINRDELYSFDGDIYCPCALGATVNDESIPQFKYDIVAGSANNQLAEERHGDILKEKGILYAPDFIINAGGVIHCHDELYGGFNRERMQVKVDQIYDQLLKVYEIAKKENISTNKAANRYAEDRIRKVLGTKKIFNRTVKASINPR